MRRDQFGYQVTSCRRYDRRIDERHAGDRGVFAAVAVLTAVLVVWSLW